MYNIRKVRNKKIVIFGTGLHGVKCIYFLQNERVEIAYCLSNNCMGDKFCGYSVYIPKAKKMMDVFVVVATSRLVYPEISKQLAESGLEEFQDYIYYEWMYKKIVLLHGNCHMEIIAELLNSSVSFTSRHSLYPNPPVYINEERRGWGEVLSNIDIWIHEDIATNNSYGYCLSDEYMRRYVRNHIVEIIVPNLYGLGKIYFPQTNWNKRNLGIADGKDLNGMFPHADMVIDNCEKRGMEVEDIIEYCMGGKAIDEQKIKENFDIYIEKIREREKSWNIKVLNYILENYRKKKLFYDIGHPTNDIMEYISHKILAKLGIKDKKIHTALCMDSHEEPVYPVVKKVLDLKWEETSIRKSDSAKKACNKMDFREYIKEYLWWCYGTAI